MEDHVSTNIWCVYIYLYIYREMAYGALQSKKSLLFRAEISYFQVLNDQSKLLNNFFMSKSYRILNFIIFGVF
jgi:hypothetical protein